MLRIFAIFAVFIVAIIALAFLAGDAWAGKKTWVNTEQGRSGSNALRMGASIITRGVKGMR